MEEMALERAVAALTILSKKKWQSGRSRGGGRPRGHQGKNPLYERHERFREDAWHWDNPKTCSWAGNE